MPAQVIAINALLISAAVLGAAVAAQLDLQIGDEQRRFYVLVAAILATVLFKALFVRRRFEPLERLIDTIVAWGDEDAIAARVQAHHDAGADHVCIQVITEQPQVTDEEWRRLSTMFDPG